jgi:hypothetical protein
MTFLLKCNWSSGGLALQLAGRTLPTAAGCLHRSSRLASKIEQGRQRDLCSRCFAQRRKDKEARGPARNSRGLTDEGGCYTGKAVSEQERFWSTTQCAGAQPKNLVRFGGGAEASGGGGLIAFGERKGSMRGKPGRCPLQWWQGCAAKENTRQHGKSCA